MSIISRFINMFALVCFALVFNLLFTPSLAMQGGRPGAGYTPATKTASAYGGYTLAGSNLHFFEEDEVEGTLNPQHIPAIVRKNEGKAYKLIINTSHGIEGKEVTVIENRKLFGKIVDFIRDNYVYEEGTQHNNTFFLNWSSTLIQSIIKAGHIPLQVIKNVKVKPCVSLGGACTDQINALIKEADEFVIVFMYRFDSPNIIRSLFDKYIEQKIGSGKSKQEIPVIVFLDHNQVYKDTAENSRYYNYVSRLLESVPVSIVKLGSTPFHQKVIITKKQGEQAFTIVGSANLTIDADNSHSEDVSIIQSNEVARIYLQEFEQLLRMEPRKKKDFLIEQTVKVFHEHRFNQDKSNIEFLNKLGSKLSEQQEEPMRDGFGYSADITSLAISTGFAGKEGNKKCWDVVQNILSQNNEALFLFENYISTDSGLGEEILYHLNQENNRSKLIVLDDNEQNLSAFDKISKINSEILKFQPYPGGSSKFHHKLIIQYPEDNLPIVYTGSFHLSTNAIEKNSETIIGIRSPEVADDYLASILLNSGLGDRPEIWQYLCSFPQLKELGERTQLRPSKLLNAAQKIHMKCHSNMERFIDKLWRIRNGLYHQDILEYIDLDYAKGNKSLDGYIVEFQKEANSSQRQELIDGMQDFVFRGEWLEEWWKKISKEWKEISNQSASKSEASSSNKTESFSSSGTSYDFDLELPIYNQGYIDVEEWLDEIDYWINESRDRINYDIEEISYKLKKPEYKLEIVPEFPDDADMEKYMIYFKQGEKKITYKLLNYSQQAVEGELNITDFKEDYENKYKARILREISKKGYIPKLPRSNTKKGGQNLEGRHLTQSLEVAKKIKEKISEIEEICVYLKDLNDLYYTFKSLADTSFWVGKFIGAD